ncbi:hypothetical protein LINPERHAP1_LOCUS30287, partial [Linum perenne]
LTLASESDFRPFSSLKPPLGTTYPDPAEVQCGWGAPSRYHLPTPTLLKFNVDGANSPWRSGKDSSS